MPRGCAPREKSLLTASRETARATETRGGNEGRELESRKQADHSLHLASASGSLRPSKGVPGATLLSPVYDEQLGRREVERGVPGHTALAPGTEPGSQAVSPSSSQSRGKGSIEGGIPGITALTAA